MGKRTSRKQGRRPDKSPPAGSRKAKMSVVLKDIAEPWFRRAGPDMSVEVATAIYDIAGVIWNVSRIRSRPGGPRSLAEARSLVRKALPALEPTDADELFDEIHQRAIERYPNEGRMFVSAQVTQSKDGGLRLDVLTAEAGR